jgi:hypothetical protein
MPTGLFALFTGLRLAAAAEAFSVIRATVYRGSGEAGAYGGADTLDMGDAVPGWRVAVAELFA